MLKAVVSGDIIASTSLSTEGKQYLIKSFENLFDTLHNLYQTDLQLVKGDFIQCYIPNSADALTITLLIKTYIKSIAREIETVEVNNPRIKYFYQHGIRLAIGIGNLEVVDKRNMVYEGDAVYFSGRLLNNLETHGKEKIVIKNTLFIKSGYDEFNNEMEPLLDLIDVIVSQSTAKQCEVLYYKLQGYAEKEIATILNKKQSTINQHSTSVGWNAIEKAVARYQQVIQKMNK